MAKKKGKKDKDKVKGKKVKEQSDSRTIPQKNLPTEHLDEFDAFNLSSSPQSAPETTSQSAPPTGSLGFLEEALRRSDSSKKELEAFMLEKVEIKTKEEKELEKSEFIPQLKSEAIPAKAETPEQIQTDLSDMAQALADFEAMEMEDMPVAIEAPVEIEEPQYMLYERLGVFFDELMVCFSQRYQMWENSTGLILTILRKMRKITKKNTEQLINCISQGHIDIKDGLTDFELKRKEVENLTGLNFTNISKDFRKILGLLELQVQEYTLKKTVTELTRY